MKFKTILKWGLGGAALIGGPATFGAWLAVQGAVAGIAAATKSSLSFIYLMKGWNDEGQEIFKVGQSSDPYQRLNDMNKPSSNDNYNEMELLMVKPVPGNKADTAEDEMIATMTDKYGEPDAGSGSEEAWLVQAEGFMPWITSFLPDSIKQTMPHWHRTETPEIIQSTMNAMQGIPIIDIAGGEPIPSDMLEAAQEGIVSTTAEAVSNVV